MSSRPAWRSAIDPAAGSISRRISTTPRCRAAARSRAPPGRASGSRSSRSSPATSPAQRCRPPLPWSPGSTTSGSSRRGRSCRRGAARISPPVACSRRERSTGSCQEAIHRLDAAEPEALYPALERLFGAVAPPEEGLIAALAARLAELAELAGEPGSTRIVAPLGVGGHVDHRIVRAAAERAFGAALLYYEEFPVHRLEALRAARAPASPDAPGRASASRSRARGGGGTDRRDRLLRFAGESPLPHSRPDRTPGPAACPPGAAASASGAARVRRRR